MYHQYATTIYEDNDEYLQSVINPWSGPVMYPDLDTTTSRPKSVRLSHQIRVSGTGNFLLWSTPKHMDPTKVLRLYGQDPDTGGYTYISDIEPDEDISENYQYARLVSAGLRIDSSTISTTNAILSGSINAVDYQDLPPLATLTYDTVLAQKRNDVDVVCAAPVYDGVVSLHHPDSQNPFRILETNAVHNSENQLVYGYVNPRGTSDPHWTTNDNNIVITWNAGADFPQDISGHTRVDFDLFCFNGFLNLVGTGTAPQAVLNVISNTLSPDDWTTPVQYQAYWSQPLTPAGEDPSQGLDRNLNITVEQYFPAPISQVTLTIQVFSEPPTGLALDSQYRLRITNLDFYEVGGRGPGTLIAFSGLQPFVGSTPGHIVNVSGIFNYEVVPNAELAKQLTTGNEVSTNNPLFLSAAISAIRRGSIHFLWNKKDYDARVTLGMAKALTNIPRNLEAAGFGDFFKSLAKVMQPVLGNVPVIGDVVNSFASRGVYRNSSNYREQPYKTPFNPPRRGAAASLDQGWLDHIAKTNVKMLQEARYPSEQSLPFPEIRDNVNPQMTQLVTLCAPRGVISQMEFTTVVNHFPLVSVDTKATAVGTIMYSSRPISETYQEMLISHEDFGDITLSVAVNGTLSVDSAFAIASAFQASGAYRGFIDIDVMGSEVDGVSIGAAAFMCFRRRQTRALLTGLITSSLQPVAVSELPAKLSLATDRPIITFHSTSNPQTPSYLGIDPKFWCGPAEAEMGDYTSTGYYPRIILCESVAAMCMASDYAMYMKNAHNNFQFGVKVSDYTLQEYIAYQDDRELPSVRAVKHTDLPDQITIGNKVIYLDDTTYEQYDTEEDRKNLRYLQDVGKIAQGADLDEIFRRADAGDRKPYKNLLKGYIPIMMNKENGLAVQNAALAVKPIFIGGVKLDEHNANAIYEANKDRVDHVTRMVEIPYKQFLVYPIMAALKNTFPNTLGKKAGVGQRAFVPPSNPGRKGVPGKPVGMPAPRPLPPPPSQPVTDKSIFYTDAGKPAVTYAQVVKSPLMQPKVDAANYFDTDVIKPPPEFTPDPEPETYVQVVEKAEIPAQPKTPQPLPQGVVYETQPTTQSADPMQTILGMLQNIGNRLDKVERGATRPLARAKQQ